MEGWLQGSDCGQPWGPLHVLQGEAPRGDIYQGHHLLQGTVREQSGRQREGWLVRHVPGSPLVCSQDASKALGSVLRRSHFLGETV